MFKCGALTLIGLVTALSAQAQTNLDVGWRICEQHATVIGKPGLGAPARMVFKPGYGECEAVQELVPTMRSEAIDPNGVMSDHLLIERAIHDPTGSPASP